MVKLNKITSLLCAAAICQAAYAVTPGSPSMSFSFAIEGDNGVVHGSVTAPLNDNQWQALPADTKMNVRVVRSCYQLGESDVAVISYEGLAPGETKEFLDEATPAWQYGYNYTYNAYASIGDEVSYQGYGSVTPGIAFSFGYGAVEAVSKAEDGVFTVDITATVPDKTNTYPAEDIPADMTALEFYRLPQGVTDLTKGVLIGKIDNPTKGEKYTYTDTEPVLNAKNVYLVKAVSKFGLAQLQTEAYVGYDVPQAPYGVDGEFQADGGYKLTWEESTGGVNGGLIDPEQTVYNVFRVWGRGEGDREQIAAGLKATEYVDYGTDMEKARAVMYVVESANNVGVGGSTSSSYDYDVVIGPAANLPYVENFDGGLNNVWEFDNSTYYGKFYIGTEAEFGDKKVEPHAGTGLIYVDYAYSYVSAGATADMTSYKIDLGKSVNPALAFYLYMIPQGNVTVKPQVSYDGGEFTDLATIAVGDCTEESWRKFVYPLQGAAGAESKIVKIRFYTEKGENGQAAIFDDITVADYLPVGNLDVEYDPDNCSALITWADPSTEYTTVTSYEGFVDGVSVGAVTSPWDYKATDYMTPVQIAVKALYGEIEAPQSASVTVSVPRPAFTEFTVDDHIFSIVEDAPATEKQIIIKQYLGDNPLYKTPEMVTYDGVTYKVTGIGEGAYRENTAIVSANITGEIETIAAEAFYGCTSMQAVSFGANLKSIGARAFAGCSELATAIFTNPEVPEVAEDAFTGIAYPCDGKCPEGTEDAYEAVPGLDPIQFKMSGIECIGNGVDADGEEVEYYNLQGVRIAKPTSGTIVIVRKANSATLRGMMNN